MRLALFVLLLFPAFAHAQPGKPSTDPGQMRTDDCARARKMNVPCVLHIDPADIEGGTAMPEGDIINIRERFKFKSLIRIRQDFISEILKTANDVE
jgi:hypothetical protein